MSRISEYAEWTGITFDEATDQAILALAGLGGSSTPTLVDSKTISGVTYKMYKRADGTLYVVNGDTGASLEGSFADNGLGGTGSSGGSNTGTLTREYLEGMGAAFDGLVARVKTASGTDVYERKASGKYELRSSGSATTTNTRPLSSAANQVLAGASKGAAAKAAAEGQSSPGQAPSQTQQQGSTGLFGLPNVNKDQITAPQSSGVVQGDLLGFLPDYLINPNQSLGSSAYPVVADANPTQGPGQGVGFAMMPPSGEIAGMSGALGDSGVGVGFDPRQILGAAGFQPTGNVQLDTQQALAAMNQRQALIEAAQGRGLTGNAAVLDAQSAIDRQIQAAGGNYGQATTYRDSGGILRDSYGMKIDETGTGQTGDVRTGAPIRPNKVSTIAGGMDAELGSPVDLFRDEFAARGYRGVTTEPTRFHTSETGQPEMVTVEPLDSGSLAQGWKPREGVAYGEDPRRMGAGRVRPYDNSVAEARQAAAAAFMEMMRQKAMAESIYLQGAENSRGMAQFGALGGIPSESAQRGTPGFGPWFGRQGGASGAAPQPAAPQQGAAPQSSFQALMESMFLSQKGGRRAPARPSGMGSW